MKFKKFIHAILFVVTSSALLIANAQDELTGDTKLACEAILCLSSPTRPGECAPSINKYFSISFRSFSKTLRARRNFLALCPQVDASIIDQIMSGNPPEPDPPEPVPVPPPAAPLLTKFEIEARINQLLPIWEAQVAVSLAARDVVELCVARYGRVQDGFCGPEMADYDMKRLPAVASRDEIYRLQDMLKNLN